MLEKKESDRVQRWLRENGYRIVWRNGTKPQKLREDGCYMLDICESADGQREAVYDFVPTAKPKPKPVKAHGYQKK